jgi:hypothetical protein
MDTLSEAAKGTLLFVDPNKELRPRFPVWRKANNAIRALFLAKRPMRS